MYELRLEAIKIIETLINEGYNACFIGNYPFIKCNNAYHQDDKLKLKQIEIATNANLDTIKSLFNVDKINDDFNKSAVLSVMVKNKIIKFKIYYLEDYVNKVNNNVISIKSIDDIIENFGFTLETITMGIDMKPKNYINKKCNAFENSKSKLIVSNGNFREKALENPLRILQLLYYASNINYHVNPAMLKIINNNYSYLKYEKIKDIIKYFNMILLSKHPFVGLNMLKNNLNKFEYKNVKLFNFLNKIPESYLMEFNNFDSSVDLINRWVYLLNYFNEKEYTAILESFELDLNFKNKILWSLENYLIIDKEDYKMSIYNSKYTLKNISKKYDVFLLFEMINRLTKLHKILDPLKSEKCQTIIDLLCSRPFFTYQVKYKDNELLKIANINDENPCNDWLEIAKEKLIQKIIMCNKHPLDDEYMQLTKESLEYGLITYMTEKEME